MIVIIAHTGSASSLLRWQYGVRTATVRTVAVRASYCPGPDVDNEASKRRRIVLLAIVRYHNVATNDGQDGPFDAPTLIRRRWVSRTSHSPTPHHCRRQQRIVDDEGGGSVLVNTATVLVPSRAGFFFNAFRLPACTIVPVPYVPYGTGTIVHAGFVPYVRTDWKKKTKTRIDPGTALNPTFGNSARTKM
jgi:hypothetical protein